MPTPASYPLNYTVNRLPHPPIRQDYDRKLFTSNVQGLLSAVPVSQYMGYNSKEGLGTGMGLILNSAMDYYLVMSFGLYGRLYNCR